MMLQVCYCMCLSFCSVTGVCLQAAVAMTEVVSLCTDTLLVSLWQEFEYTVVDAKKAWLSVELSVVVLLGSKQQGQRILPYVRRSRLIFGCPW